MVLYSSSVDQKIAVDENSWAEELKLEIDMINKAVYVYDVFENTWRNLMSCFNMPDMKGNYREKWILNDKVAKDNLLAGSHVYKLLPLILFIGVR